jgi:hypothetical protein
MTLVGALEGEFEHADHRNDRPNLKKY